MATENEKQKSMKTDLDTILIEELGQFGKYQVKAMALMGMVAWFISWAAGEYLFTTARINTRCLIHECESAETTEYSPPWIFNAVPASGTSFDNCQRFESSNASTYYEEDVCPASWFDHDTVIGCDEFVFENRNSIVYDYNLACEEWRRSLIGSVRTVGDFITLPITGYISDRWGRRTALAIASMNSALIGTTRYFANTYTGFLISQFAETVFGGGGFSSVYILTMEIVGPKFRVVAGAFINTSFATGQMVLGLIAWGVPNWQNLTLTLYIPQFLSISYFWILTESVRWYISKERFDDAEKVLKKIARVNGKELSEERLQNLKETAIEDAKQKKKLSEEQNVREPWLIELVFQHKQILKRVIVTPIWWITMTFVYYGMTINSINISGNRYVNFIAVSAVEIPGYWTAVLLMGIVGRKPVLIGAYWACALCQVAYIFLPQGLFGVSLTMYLLGKYSISMVVTTLYAYTAELYPTRFRHRLFAFSSMIGRIGSILAPLTPAFAASVWDDLPFALFGGMAFISGLTVFVTPETLNTKLPNTMEQASEVGRKAKS